MAVQVKASQNGPYVITGMATYIDAEGNEQKTPGSAIALCRCGQSSNKPFCDGTHRKVGFQSPEVILTMAGD
jgi:CDGSH-type Zn-finger protein